MEDLEELNEMELNDEFEVEGETPWKRLLTRIEIPVSPKKVENKLRAILRMQISHLVHF